MNAFEKMTHQLRETLEQALSLALHAKNPEVDLPHMAWALLINSTSILNQALNKMGMDKSALELEAKSLVDRLPQSSSLTKENIKISKRLADSLTQAEALGVKGGR